jgi:hypothetical protein
MTRSSAGRGLREVSHPGTCEKPLVTHRRSAVVNTGVFGERSWSAVQIRRPAVELAC